MKKFLSILAVIFAVGLSTVAVDAEAAKRMGSGKSLGMQRQGTPDKAPNAPNQAAAAAPAAGAAAAATPSRSWMGPVAGIAAGLGLAALASHLGMGDELASMVMLGLLAAAIMVAVGFFMRKRAAAAQSSAPTAPGGMRYAHVNPGAASNGQKPLDATPSYKVLMPAAPTAEKSSQHGSMIGSGLGSTSKFPAGFDAAGFERNAKVNFIRLQAAYDANNQDDIRQFVTPEMFAELTLELAEREAGPHKTEVRSIDTQVIEVEEEANRYVVSVRFTGVIRDAVLAADEPFDEVWHLTKPRESDGGWVLSGIQQMA